MTIKLAKAQVTIVEGAPPFVGGETAREWIFTIQNKAIQRVQRVSYHDGDHQCTDEIMCDQVPENICEEFERQVGIQFHLY